MTLTQSEVIAFIQAAALIERQPVAGFGARLADVTAESWAGETIGSGRVLAEYLTAHAIDHEGLRALLSGGAWKPRPGSMAWMHNIEAWLLPDSVARSPRGPAIVVENTLLSETPFPALIEPIVASQQGYFDEWPWCGPLGRASLLMRLRERIAELALRSLLVEIAGSGGYVDLNEALMRRESRVNLFARYPLLARDIITGIQAWRLQVSRILSHLADDAPELRSRRLLSCEHSALQAVEFTGDQHNGGQSVAILVFDDGARLVYKPRDCRTFEIYHGFLSIIAAELEPEARLYPLKFLARRGYGWIEFIDHAPSSLAPESHLRKLGALLAVSQVLGASDLHLENVIASTYGPVPVDLETLIQNRSHSGNRETASSLAAAKLNASVLGTGILPVQLTAGEGTSIDISAATGGLHFAGQQTALVHQVIDPFTDSMRIEATEAPLGRSKNQPPGMTTDLVRRYRKALCQGFEEASCAIIAQRERLVMLLENAPNVAIRHIVRATRSYSLLLTEFRQPSRLCTGLERDYLLRSLWVRLNDYPGEVQLIRAEERALRRLDVPLFHTTLDSRSLYAGEDEMAPRYFMLTARKDVIARLNALSVDSISESVRLIDESIMAATPTVTRARPSKGRSGRHSSDPSTVFSGVGRQQALTLLDTAIMGKDDATWVSVASSTDSVGLEYRPLGPTLYDGLAGVSFAVTYAHKVYPDLGLDGLARRTARAVAAILREWTEARLNLPIGAFSGAAGLLYALGHYEAEFGSTQHRLLMRAAIRRLGEAVNSDIYFDVMAGAAGAIAVVTSEPLRAVNADEVMATVRALAGHLVKNAVRVDNVALAWETGQTRARLGGFSHGATGIGWALARAAAYLHDEDLAHAARDALRFDDTLFDPSRNLWLDARPESLAEGHLYPVYWCHGAAGISMARASVADLLGSATLLERARLGGLITATSPLPADDSLCHGSLGNYLSIESPTLSLVSPGKLAEFRETLADRLSWAVPKSGLPDGITTVRGLMLGTAGAVYALSKLTDPSIPNVLLLE